MSLLKTNSKYNIKLYSTDDYFCKNCNQGWKDNKWMECCKGCVGHRNMGWTIQDMQTTYGIAMDSLIKRGLAPDYYFPMVKRNLPPKRIPYRTTRCLVKSDILQPFVHYSLDWRLQQSKLLKDFTRCKNRDTWDSLDPEVQHKVLFKERIKY